MCILAVLSVTVGMTWFFIEAWIFAIRDKEVWLMGLLAITTATVIFSHAYFIWLAIAHREQFYMMLIPSNDSLKPRGVTTENRTLFATFLYDPLACLSVRRNEEGQEVIGWELRPTPLTAEEQDLFQSPKGHLDPCMDVDSVKWTPKIDSKIRNRSRSDSLWSTAGVRGSTVPKVRLNSGGDGEMEGAGIGEWVDSSNGVGMGKDSCTQAATGIEATEFLSWSTRGDLESGDCLCSPSPITQYDGTSSDTADTYSSRSDWDRVEVRAALNVDSSENDRQHGEESKEGGNKTIPIEELGADQLSVTSNTTKSPIRGVASNLRERCGRDGYTLREAITGGNDIEAGGQGIMKASTRRLRRDGKGEQGNHQDSIAIVHVHELPDMCSICLGEYEEHETVHVLPCLHMYHKECLDTWIEGHDSCPFCKINLNVHPPTLTAYQRNKRLLEALLMLPLLPPRSYWSHIIGSPNPPSAPSHDLHEML